MNWYKKAQEFPPIAITSYDSYGNLGITFNGGKKYVYPDVSPYYYDYIKKFLKVKNYKKVQEILKNLSLSSPTSEEDKQVMLDQLYDEGYLT